MLVLLLLLGLAVAGRADAETHAVVDGIPVYGKVEDVFRAEIHEAAVAYADGRLEKPAALPRMNSTCGSGNMHSLSWLRRQGSCSVQV